MVNRLEREENEKIKIRQVIKEIVEDDDIAMRSIEEHHRMGKYEENKDRPIKIKFATQAQAEEVIYNAWKLAGKEDFRGVWINKDMDVEERQLLKELIAEAKEKNEMRSEEDKVKYYWKVIDLKLRKRWYRK